MIKSLFARKALLPNAAENDAGPVFRDSNDAKNFLATLIALVPSHNIIGLEDGTKYVPHVYHATNSLPNGDQVIVRLTEAKERLCQILEIQNADIDSEKRTELFESTAKEYAMALSSLVFVMNHSPSVFFKPIDPVLEKDVSIGDLEKMNTRFPMLLSKENLEKFKNFVSAIENATGISFKPPVKRTFLGFKGQEFILRAQ